MTQAASEDKTPFLSIVIISYNTKDLTIDCIRSVIEQTKQTSYELIILDNDSPDGSAQAIKAAFPDINLIASKENYGFAAGNNVAAKEAKGEFLLLLNPDTVVLDGAIDKLVDFSKQHPEAKIWGGRTLFEDQTLNATSCYQNATLWSLACRLTGISNMFSRSEFFNPENYGNWQRDTVRQVDIVTGCFLLIPTKLWNTLGGFDEKFFMFGEEVDLCLRATKEHGARPIVTPDATIIHYGGRSVAVRADRMVAVLRAKMSVYKRHWSSMTRPLALQLFYLWPFSRAAVLKIASTIFRNEKLKQKSDTWNQIWKRREEWKNGYASIN